MPTLGLIEGDGVQIPQRAQNADVGEATHCENSPDSLWGRRALIHAREVLAVVGETFWGLDKEATVWIACEDTASE